MRGGLETVLPRVQEIVGDVRARGDEALLDWSERLDGERPELRVRGARLEAARLDDDVLAAEGQIAVHAAVDVDELWNLLSPLKAAGASSILVLPVERLVP